MTSMLSTSRTDREVQECYSLQASGYISKPVDYEEFVRVVRALTGYWTGVVTLPPHTDPETVLG